MQQQRTKGGTIKTAIKNRPAEFGRFASALGVADEAVLWAADKGDGTTWHVLFTRTTGRKGSDPLFIVDVWVGGGRIEMITEPRQVGTLADFDALLASLGRQRNLVSGNGDARLH